MPNDKDESPSSAEQSAGDKLYMNDPLKISPAALELLRSAAIPLEFLKIVREFTSHTMDDGATSSNPPRLSDVC